MKILILNHYAGSADMGMEFRPYYMGQEWVKAGHSVSIIAADFSHLRQNNPVISLDLQKENIDGIDYYWVKTLHYNSSGVKRSVTMAQYVVKLWLKASWIVKKIQPDVVICSSTYPLDTYVGQRIKKLSKKPVKLVHEIHDMWPLSPMELGGMSKYNPFIIAMQMGENSFCKNSDLVVSLLPNSKEYLVEHGMSENKFSCIPNGIVKEEWQNPQALPNEHEAVLKKLKNEHKFIIGYFGGHSLSNSLDTLLEVAAKTEDPEIVYVLVGKGNQKENLIQQASELKLKNVIFLEAISKKAIPNLCKYFDLIYMCGKDSPLYRFGLCLNKMFDTMASGKPGLCALGVESYFTQFNCGIDCATDAKSISSHITMLKNMTPEQLRLMGKNGKRASEELFNYSKLAEKFLALIE